jgi:cytochrome P450
MPILRVATRFPFLNAIVKETLRLYAPLPDFETRSSPQPTVIDNYPIPANNTVGMSPYTLHRKSIHLLLPCSCPRNQHLDPRE